MATIEETAPMYLVSNGEEILLYTDKDKAESRIKAWRGIGCDVSWTYARNSESLIDVKGRL